MLKPQSSRSEQRQHVRCEEIQFGRVIVEADLRAVDARFMQFLQRVGHVVGVADNLDVTGAYYHYDQPTFGAPVNCAVAATPATCRGTFDAVSFVADWQFAKKFDAYAGFMFSQVNGGLANGYLNRSTIDPTVGLRFRF